MKIKLMSISNYGCLDKKNIELGDGISVIKGDNESGKSTTHQAILAAMFGFVNNGSKKSFKLLKKAESFSGKLPKIESRISDNAGEIIVTRYFEGNFPKTGTDSKGVVKVYDNEPLELLMGMSRQTYEGIYSLDIDKIASLKESWEREQDSILSGLYPEFLLPNDKIEENLDKKIKEIWKGKTSAGKARELDARLTEKKNLLREAKAAQKELRNLEIEEEDTQTQILLCGRQIEKSGKEQIELNRQLDFFTEYRDIKNAMAETIQAKDYEYLPKDIKMHIENLEQEIKQKSSEKHDKEKREKDLEEIIDQYKGEKENINMLKELVPQAEKLSMEAEAKKSGIARSVEREKNKRNQMESKSKRIFTNEFVWDDFKNIMKIDVADCFSYLDNMQALNEEKAKAGRKALEERERSKISSLWRIMPAVLTAAAGIAGTVMMFVNIGIPRNISVYAGAGLLAAAALASILLGIRKGKAPEGDDSLGRLKQLEKEHNTELAKLQGSLNFGFVPAEKRKNPDKPFVELIAQIQDDYSEYTELEKETQEDEKAHEALKSEIEKIMVIALGQGARRETAAEDMRKKLNDFLILESDARAAVNELESVKRQIAELAQSIKLKEDILHKIVEALQAFPGDNTIERAQNLQDMRERLQSAAGRIKVLSVKYDDFVALEKSAGGNPDVKIYEINNKIETLAESLKTLNQEKSRLDTKKGELHSKIELLKKNSASPAVIEGEIDDLRQEIEQRKKLRDQYVLCHSLIQKAREKFVSEFSPDFMDKAGDYLSIITSGRYTKIRLGEKGTSIMVADSSAWVFDFDTIDSNISRGTKEQIYLALRLAMLERFDPAGNRLPVILDEALVNWDAIRFKKLMEIMNDIAKQRQIFIFTCHDYVYDIVKETAENSRLINI